MKPRHAPKPGRYSRHQIFVTSALVAHTTTEKTAASNWVTGNLSNKTGCGKSNNANEAPPLKGAPLTVAARSTHSDRARSS